MKKESVKVEVKPDMKFDDYEKAKSKGETKKRRGPVREMRIHPTAGGGAVSETEHEDMGGADRGMMMHMPQVMKKHHKTPEDLASHVSKVFGGKQMVPATPEAEEESEAAGAGGTNEG